MFTPLFWLIMVMVMTFLLSVLLSLLESAWFKISITTVVKYELESHDESAATKLIKKMLAEQPIVVSFILLMIYLNLCGGTLLIGNLETKINVSWFPIVLIIFPFVMFYLGEMVPKILGMKRPLLYVKASAYIIYILIKICFPIVWLIRMTAKATGGYQEQHGEKDILAATRLACADRALSAEEAAILERYLTVNNLTAKDLMVPLDGCWKTKKTTSRQELLSAVRKDRPIVVTDDTKPKIVIGFVSEDDLLEFVLAHNEGKLDLSSLVGATVEIPEHMLIGEAYALLRKNPVGRVIDENGKTLGFITLHDIAVKFLKAKDGLE